jgi:putative redox protein
MDMTVRYLGGKKFEATARGHRILSDQPNDDCGSDAGMTPPELFVASLGSCAGYYAAEYLNARSLPSEGLEVRISGVKGEKPARLVSISVDVIAPGLTKHHRDGILRAVDVCLLTNSLHFPPRLEVHVRSNADALVEEAVPVG